MTKALAMVMVETLRAKSWKNKLKSEAERRFPGQKVTLKNCDALLILEAAIILESQKLL